MNRTKALEELNRKVTISKLEELGIRYGADEWKVRGIHVWPLVRQKVWWDLFRAGRRGRPLKEGISGRIKLILIGVRELMSFLFVRRNARITFVTKSTYRAEYQGVYYDKFCDTLLEFCPREISESAAILESGVDFKYRRPSPSDNKPVEIQGMLYMVRLIADIGQIVFRYAKLNDPRYSDFKEDVKNAFDRDVRFGRANLERYMARVILMEKLFRYFYRKNGTGLVFTVCYYEDYCFAANIAAFKLGITSIDLQHGVQGPYHPAYAPMTRIPNKGFAMVPRVFWVWNSSSYQNIANWNTEEHVGILGGNPWMQFFEKFSGRETTISRADLDKPNIMVSLQPVDEVLPDFLVSAIKTTADFYCWQIRLHPRQFGKIDEIKKKLAERKIGDFVELDMPTNLPLPILLKQTTVHITQWSSVVIEASELGVPSILIHQNGEAMYPREEFGDLVETAFSDVDLVSKLAECVSRYDRQEERSFTMEIYNDLINTLKNAFNNQEAS